MGLLRNAALALTSSAVMVVGASTAGAQTYIAGTATACFQQTAVMCTPASTSTDQGAKYTGSTFSGTTYGTPNRVSFGGNPSSGIDNFGAVQLMTGTAGDYTGNMFQLLLAFTNPSNANAQFVANMSGQVSAGNDGSLSIAFSNPDQTFSYGSGYSFTVHVNNLDINPSQTTSVTGNVTSTVPEPGSMALLGTGLVGLVPMIRRRKKA